MSQEVNTVMLSKIVYDDLMETARKYDDLKDKATVGLLQQYVSRHDSYRTVVVGAEKVYVEINKKLLGELERATERLGWLERKLSDKELINRTPKTHWWDVFSKFKEKSE